MDRAAYKSLHESLTSKNNGTTVLESFAVVLPSIIALYILPASQALLTRRLNTKKGKAHYHNEISLFTIEFLCTIVPCILSFTIGANYLVCIIAVQFILCFVLFVFNHVHDPKIVRELNNWKTYNILSTHKFENKPRSFITNFRAITNILTVLCILAVDFHIFPRRFAKTETFGYGVMDLGVGLFVIANALVAPEARSSSATTVPLQKAALDCLPLLSLGIGRLVFVQQFEYQEHVTEYGQHWNFFFTLAVTKFACTFILKCVKNSILMYIVTSTLLITSYEFLLYLGIRDWILSDNPRDGFVSANREGIASNIGYVALYFGGIALGKVLYKWDGLNALANLFVAKKLFALSSLLWIMTFVCERFLGVSRRLANMGYYLWILSFTTSVILILLLLEFFVLLLKFSAVYSKKDQPNANVTFTPCLFEAINRNGLFFFLSGNVFTGIINMRLQTFQVGPLASLLVISLYMLANCLTVSILPSKINSLKISK